ncbi:MAG: helix-turn-helix domain-containing protein [Thermodesulfobacteriota bacterium]|nr:helix-turn-helix domain-containing protein [Thermodesulfobacteriota bacterium]
MKIADDQLYTVEEVADILRCGRETVRRKIKSKAIGATKIGRDYRITGVELKRFINEGEPKAISA